VFQDPLSALNPTARIGNQIAENILAHRDVSKKEALAEAVRILEKVGIEDPQRRVHQYPHELSGGMRQRVMIAIAFSCRPQLLIADEPTTALDVTIQTRVLELLQELHRETKTSIILITHDLGVVAGIAEKVYVMYAGKIVESGSTASIFYHARHPYTKALLASVPRMTMTNKEPLPFIIGTPPDLAAPPKGCTFAPRCIHCMNICVEQHPDVAGFGSGHFLSCWLQSLEDVAL
jgi:oligopeptide transport system ATP-binding protein